MDPSMMHQMGPGDMGMVGQGMGMGMGDGMGGQPMPGPGMGGQGMVGPPMGNGALSGGVAISSGGQGRATPDVQMGMMGDGFQGGPQGAGQQGMGMQMGNEFGMQVSRDSHVVYASSLIADVAARMVGDESANVPWRRRSWDTRAKLNTCARRHTWALWKRSRNTCPADGCPRIPRWQLCWARSR